MQIIEKRINEIVKFIKTDSTVLSIGCAGDFTLHKMLAKKTNRLKGIDIDKKAIKELTKLNYNVEMYDAENFNLHRKFDFIVIGELIEHLSNPGEMLACATEHLNKRGKIILTTPNLNSLFIFFTVGILNIAQDATHVAYFDQKSIKTLVMRNSNLSLVEIKYIPPTIKAIDGNLIFKIAFYVATLCANIGFYFSPRLFGSYILVILNKKIKYVRNMRNNKIRSTL